MSDDLELNLFSKVGSLDALESQASEARAVISGRPDDPARAAVEASYYKRRSELQEALFKPKREAYEREQASKQRRERYPLASAMNVDLGLGLSDDDPRWDKAEATFTRLVESVQQATLDGDPEFQDKLATKLAHAAYGPAGGPRGYPVSAGNEAVQQVQATNRKIQNGEKLSRTEGRAFVDTVGNHAIGQLLRANRRGAGK